MKPEQVAQWMVEELERVDFLYQDTVVYDIAAKFGDDFTYINQNGNLAINRDVLAKFRELTGDTVMWEKGTRMWRKREEHDPTGRQVE